MKLIFKILVIVAAVYLAIRSLAEDRFRKRVFLTLLGTHDQYYIGDLKNNLLRVRQAMDAR